MSRDHLMIDVETLSSDSDAALIQVAAVWYDLWENDIEKPEFWENPLADERRAFSRNISFESAVQFGSVNGKTLAWWMGAAEDSPSQEARDALFSPAPIPLGQALYELSQWVTATKPKDGPYVWSHATFDPPVLTHAFETQRKPQPWAFRANRDMRTICWLAFGPHRMTGIPEDHEHIAVWDCWREVFMAQKSFYTLRYRGIHPEVTGVSLERSPFGG